MSGTLALFYLRHALFFGVAALVSYISGRLLLRGLAFDSAFEEIAYCGGVGLGLWGTGIFLLGISKALDPRALVLLAAVAVVAGHGEWSRIWRAAATALRGRWQRCLLFLLLAAALPILLLALYPPFAFDATMYHLAEARIYARDNAILPLPYVRFSFFPQLNEMLFAAGLSVADDLSAQLLEVLCLALAGAAAAGIACRIFAPRTGPWAAALWLGSPLVLTFGTTGHVEVGVALFGALAAGSLVAWRDTSQIQWAIVGGICAGFAAATKYTGLFFVGAVFALLLAAGRREGRGVRPAAGFGVAATLCALPWYLRTFLLTGNPVYPLASRLFGAGPWNATDVVRLQQALRASNASGTVSGLARALAERIWSDRLLGIGPPFGAFGYLLFPLLLLAVIREPRARLLGALLLAYLATWFSTDQNLRFLLPILPVAAALAAGGMEQAVAAVSRIPLADRARRGMIPVVGAAFFIPAVVWPIGQLAVNGPPPVTRAGREAFLTARLPAYPCYGYLNRLRGSNYRVWGFNDERMNYFADGTRIGDLFGPGRYDDLDRRSGSALAASMRRKGADFLMITQCARGACVPADAEFQRLFRLRCESPGTRLYELLPSAQAGP